MDDDPLLTVTDVARFLRIQRNTVTSVRARGHMPEPDAQYGRTPLWRESTIRAWKPITTLGRAYNPAPATGPAEQQ